MHFRTTISWLAIICFLCCGIAPPNLFAQLEEQIPAEREAFLDEIQKKAFFYFLEQVNPANGLVRDWAFNKPNPFYPLNKPGSSPAPATIAGTGFALSAYAVGVDRGWLGRSGAIRIVRKTLLFLRDKARLGNGVKS